MVRTLLIALALAATSAGIAAPAPAIEPSERLTDTGTPYVFSLAPTAGQQAGPGWVDEIPAEAVRIDIAGDVNLGGKIADRIRAGGINWPWTHVAPTLRAADIAVVNLECAVSDRGVAVAGKEYTFRGAPAALRGMADAGIDVVSVANNHALDFGRDAFTDTVAGVRGAGMRVVGGGAHEREAYAPQIVEAKGRRIAFVAASRILPSGFAAGARTPGVASAYQERRLLDAVRSAKQQAETVVVFLHWGVELAPEPNATQTGLAAKLFAEGAHVVAGAHPHVLQPAKFTPDGRLAAYSLGNFVFSSGSVASTTTMILQIGIMPDDSIVASRVPVRIVNGRPLPT